MGVWGSMKAGYREAMTGELDVEYRQQEADRRAARLEEHKAAAIARREQRKAALDERLADKKRRRAERKTASEAVARASDGETPGVHSRMTVELWICLGIGLTALSWNGLGAFALLILAGCIIVGVIQHRVRVRREMERQQLLPDPDRSVERADPAA